MQKQEDGGSIVMISSVSGSRPSPGTAAYGAAKAGIDSLAASLSVEWAPKVRVNSIVVGLVQTELSHLHYGDEAGIDAVGATVPLGRMAVPRTSATVRHSWHHRWRPTSAVRPLPSTAAASARPSWPRLLLKENK